MPTSSNYARYAGIGGGGGGGGANQHLSNLLSPTAINEDLLPGADNSINIGSDSLGFESVHTYVIDSNSEQLDILSSDVDFFSGALDINQTYAPLIFGSQPTLAIVANSAQLTSSTPFFIGTSDVVGTVADNYPGDILIATGDNANEPTPAQATGSIYLFTGNQDSADSSGSSGEMLLQTGATSGSGNTGQIQFQTGTVNGTGFGSGSLSFSTGDGVGTSVSGNMQFITGGTVDGGSGGYDMETGSCNGAGNSGAYNMSTGSVNTGTSGTMVIQTGVANDQFGSSGDINIITGQINGGTGLELPNVGNINIITGQASGSNDGNITLGIGQGFPSAPPQKGYILFQDGTQGTSGSVWTSIDNQGSGAWMPGTNYTPFEILPTYAADYLGTGSFAGNDSDEDQGNLLAMFGSTDTANPLNSSSNVSLQAGDLLSSSLDPGVFAGSVYVIGGNISSDASGNAISAGSINLIGGQSIDGNAGNIFVSGGNAISGTATGVGGSLSFTAGTSAGVGIGGGISINAGSANTATGGSISINTGSSSSGTGGNFNIQTGGGAAQGVIQFQDGSEGTAGYAWTSVDTNGTGAWQAIVVDAGTLAGTTLNSTVVASSLTSLGVQSQDLDMGSNNIDNVTDPTTAQQAATKNYVDTVASQLNPLQAVFAASTANIAGTYVQVGGGIGDTFTTTSTSTFTIDGQTPSLTQRLLFKNQTSGQQNGVYTFTVLPVGGISGAIFTRALDYDTTTDINAGDLIPVINGTTNANTSWLQTATVTSVGTSGTPLVFAQWTANPANYLLKANNLSDVSSISASFNNISPMTTGGDLIYGGASGTGTRLANGSSGQVLTSTGGTSAPIWTTFSAVSFAQWTGYFPGTATDYWSTNATGSYADFTTTGSPALSIRQNFNMGTVSAAGSTLPGITFTAPHTGILQISAKLIIFPGQAPTPYEVDMQLYESVTTTVVDQTGIYAGNASLQDMQQVTLEGYFNATASTAYTFIIQGRGSASGAFLYIGGVSLASCLSFNMNYLT